MQLSISTCTILYFCFRFERLLQKDTIVLCLEKEDPTLTSSLLSLLTLMVRSENLVGNLCSRDEPCILGTLYQHLSELPPAPSLSLTETQNGEMGEGKGGGGDEGSSGKEDCAIQLQVRIRFKCLYVRVICMYLCIILCMYVLIHVVMFPLYANALSCVPSAILIW